MGKFSSLAQFLEGFRTLSVLVIGDICLDLWCQYDPAYSEASRETGIPRIAVVSVAGTAGACGTIANNLSDLGVGRVSLLGVIGDDAHGLELFSALNRREINVDLVLRSPLVQTFTYVKHINIQTGVEDLPRVDFINTREIERSLEEQLVHNIEAYAPLFDAVIVCDQAETDAGGIVTAAVRETINALAAKGQLVWVDSRRRAEQFRHCYLKPNEQEAREASERLLGEVDLERFYKILELRALVVTEGERGARVVDGAEARSIAAPLVANVVDICGAGDSFSAGAVAALASGASIDEALRLGTLVASITITKKGTGTATPAEVLAAAGQ